VVVVRDPGRVGELEVPIRPLCAKEPALEVELADALAENAVTRVDFFVEN